MSFFNFILDLEYIILHIYVPSIIGVVILFFFPLDMLH